MIPQYFLRTKKRIIGCIPLLLLIIFVSIAAGYSQSLESSLDEFVAAHAILEKFSGTVLVAQKGEILLSKGYGLADRELNVPNTPAHKFRLGSITKQFTAMIIMQMEQKGMLKTDDFIQKHLPDFPNGDRITIHHLLTHTSGIPNFTNFPEYQETSMLSSPPAKTLERFQDKALEFEPGEQYNYSNSGYVLLGHIIETVSGRSYEDLLKEWIFDPLGMYDSGYDDSKAILENRARGYGQGSDGIENADYLDMTIPHAAGALYSTTLDLYKWDRSLYIDMLLPQEAMDRMFTPFKRGYAYGWGVRDTEQGRRIAHSGGIDGFVTNITRLVDEDGVVIVLSNFEFASTRSIVTGLIQLLHDEEPEWPKERIALEISQSAFDVMTGKYELSPGFILTVFQEDGAYYIQATNQGPVQVWAESETSLFAKSLDIQLNFQSITEGKARELVFKQSGQVIQAKRVE